MASLDDILESALQDYEQAAAPAAEPQVATAAAGAAASSPAAPQAAPLAATQDAATQAEDSETATVDAPAQAPASAHDGAGAGAGEDQSLAHNLKMLADLVNAPGADPQAAEQLKQLQQLFEATQQPSEAATAAGIPPIDFSNTKSIDDFLSQTLGDINDADVQDALIQMFKPWVSKSLLHKPMMQLRDKFPSWIEKNRGTLDQQALAKCEQQLESARRLCEVFEAQKGDDDEGTLLAVVQLLQEVRYPQCRGNPVYQVLAAI
eukprot:TRINITY_DN4953_c0_g2_i2.p1 TRINITY_DN4953_c0_g2~~TRINITY_DN4953_c0_g2_i2.p1  ORF type:complete len:274 (+),score=83.82 TRINITY_DN4953_c0_g2_i2:36-824(+)